MSLLDDASIVITPNGVKVSTLFAVIPSDGAADMDFTRATTATRIDENGDIVEVGDGVPRIDYEGGGCPHILAEPQRTNLVFPSDVPSTQTRTVTAVEHSFTFYGTGTVVLSGAHSETLVGTGANDRFELKFTPTAGSLTLTVTGTVRNWQLEVGSYPTSLIETSVGTVTRNQETFTRDGISSLINSDEGVLFVEMATLSDDLTNRGISLNDGTSSNRLLLYFNTTSNQIVVISTGFTGSISYTLPDETSFNKFAVRYKANDITLWVDGESRGTPIVSATIPTFTALKFDSGAGASPFYGKVKQLQVYKTALTDTQLEELTSYVPSFLLEDNGFLLQEDGNKIII